MTKKFFLSIAPYLIVVCLLILAELGLRLWVPSLETPIVNEVKYDGINWYQVNRGYLKKYFAASTPLVPEFKGSLFRKEKLAGTFRIFCLGESSMFGTPYQMTANIPGILRKQLRHLYPEKDIEVVNFGASAVNSNAVLDLSNDLLQFKPDLVCIYLGHNEFYGPDGVGATFIEKRFPFLISLKYRLRDLRLTKLVSSWIYGTTPPPAEMNLMKQVSEGNKVLLYSDEAADIFKRFESNFDSIVDVWKSASVPIIASDVTSNLMFPPFVSPDVDPQAMKTVTDNFAAGRFTDALKVLDGMRQSDSTNALVEFWRGKTLRAIGDFNSAKAAFVHARDLDLLKFRAPRETNEVIRRVCTERNVQLVSSDSALSALSPNGITGEEYFWEHLHPKVEGYYEIAALYAKTIVDQKFVNGEPLARSVSLLPINFDTLSICWFDLAYADLSIRRLTSQWPFNNYKREPVVIQSADSTLLSVALATQERKLVWDDACYRTAEYFWRTGNLRAAKTTYEAVLEEYPTNFYAHYLLGSLLARMGNVQAALHHFNRSVAGNPEYPQARLDAGLLLINQGEFEAAIQILDLALPLTEKKELKALRASVYYGLGAAYANKENYIEALKNLDEALQLVPNYGDATKLKNGILNLGRK